MSNRFQKCIRALRWLSEVTITIERGHHFPFCRCVEPFSEPFIGSSNLRLQLRGNDIFLLVAMPNRFQKYKRALRRHSETMLIAEREWHVPPCRYAKSFPKVWENFWAALRNYDYSWERLIFSSLSLCQIVFKSMGELFDGTRTELRGVDIFLFVAMPGRFQKYEGTFGRRPETMIIAERGWHFPPCCYAKSFSKVWESSSTALGNCDYSWEGLHFLPCRYAKSFSKVCESSSTALGSYDYSWEGIDIFLFVAMPSRFQKYERACGRHSETMIIAERGWHFPPCRYAKSFSKVWESSLTTLGNYDYSRERLTFSSLSLCQIVFKSMRELFDGTRKLWL